MAGTFSLADLVPEPLTFRDDRFGGEGRSHDVKTRDMLGAVEIARIERLQKRLQGAQKDDNPDDHQLVATELEKAVDEICTILIVGLPAERLAAIPFGFKLKFLEWWHVQQQGEDEPGGKPASQRKS